MTRSALLATAFCAIAAIAAGTAQAAPAHRPSLRPPAANAPAKPLPPTRAGLRGPNEPGRRLQVAMNLLDPEGKGYLTWEDFYRGRGHASRVFTALDTDGDGTISRREFLAGGDGGRAAEFARLDRDKDGTLTLAEFQRGWNRELFDALSGGRGYLTAGDLQPGFSTVAMLPPAGHPATAEYPPPAAPEGAAKMGCWIPLTPHHEHWALIFPWTGCR